MRSALAELPPLDPELLSADADLNEQRRMATLRSRSMRARSQSLKNLAECELRQIGEARRKREVRDEGPDT